MKMLMTRTNIAQFLPPCAVIVAVAALRRQNCELDEDIANLPRRCGVSTSYAHARRLIPLYFLTLANPARYPAKVAELVDALDLESSGETREGSSPSFRIPAIDLS
jgi:hypothetical protein